jgi:hypothetical protein
MTTMNVRDLTGPARGRRARASLATAVLLGLGLAAVAHAGGDARDGPRSTTSARSAQAEPPLDPSRFSTTVDNPLFPLAKLHFVRMTGSERSRDTRRRIRIRVETRVLPTTSRVAGVPVAVVEDKDFENGRLVEHTFDYYAQDADGNVWYFGERIDNIERGKVVSHEGQWLAGERGAKPGLFMPAKPKLGQTFAQERAPGVAEDRSKVVALGIRMKTPARVFTGCIKTRDSSPLDGVVEFKYYCPGVGIAREAEPPGGKFDVVKFG